MKNVLLNETVYIDEKSYQKIKKELNKKNDFFNRKEIFLDNIFDNVLDGINRKKKLNRQ